METECPHCQKVFSVPEQYKGKQIKCLSCHKTLLAKPMAKTLNRQPKVQSPPSDSNRNLWIGTITISTVLILFIITVFLDYSVGILLFTMLLALFVIWQWNEKAKNMQKLIIEMRSIYAIARKGKISKSSADKFFNLADKAILMMSSKEEKEIVGTERTTVGSLRNEIQNMSNQISLILTLRTPTASVGEEIDTLANLRKKGMISDMEFQEFSERFKLTTGEKASDIIKSISELYGQHQKGAMSKGNFHAALWSLLDKLDRKT